MVQMQLKRVSSVEQCTPNQLLISFIYTIDSFLMSDFITLIRLILLP